MTLELALLIAVLLYLSQVGVFIYGIRNTRDSTSGKATPFVSVVIAARNEEQNLAECLQSVFRQTYPEEMYEVIVVDDGSSDRTPEICNEMGKGRGNFLSFTAREDVLLKGKTNALEQGIGRAHGEIVLITDADCTVPTTWIEHTAKRFAPNVGIVGGMTLQKASGAFEGMQSLDWAYLLGLASATVALQNPLSTIGNNLSFRRAAYEDVGGFRKIPFSVTEDFMLFQAIVGTRKWEYLYPVDPNVLVLSKPCTTLNELARQKQRWGKGGLDMKFSGFAIMVVGFLTHALILLGLGFGAFLPAASAIMLKLIGDYAFLYQTLKRLERTDLLRYFYFFQAYYILYVLLLPCAVFFGGKVKWKGRVY
ncbi:MAG TPA: glycosyl transferase [Bacteroidetes bacterium]|nr:glycosyl transferase [Bacteroidota bacterium]